MDFRSRIVNSGKDLLTGLSDQFIKDGEIRGFTNKIINDTAQSFHDMNKSRLSEQSLHENNKPASDQSINNNTKPSGGFFSKIGGFFKNLFNKIRSPVQGLIGKIPGVGSLINSAIDKFVPIAKGGTASLKPPNPATAFGQ